MKYKVKYYSGSAQEYQDGIWEVKKTAKTITFEKIAHHMSGIYSMHDVGYKTKNMENKVAHPVKYEDENGFTVYFNRAGIPYIFELIK